MIINVIKNTNKEWAFDKNLYETPQYFFDYWNRIYNFSFDLAAEKETAKCKRYFTKEDDAMNQDWHKLNGWLWLNPPYNPCKKWIQKAQRESKLGSKIVVLIPCMLGTRYLYEYLPSELYIIVGRVSFYYNKKEKKGNCLYSCVAVFYDEIREPKVSWIPIEDIKMGGRLET